MPGTQLTKPTTPFAGTPPDPRLPDAACAWCLAAPLTIGEDILSVNDPLYPFEVPVPPHLLGDVRTLVPAVRATRVDPMVVLRDE